MNACYKSLEVTYIYVFGVETVTLCVCRGQTTACLYGSWGLSSSPQVCQQVLLPLSCSWSGRPLTAAQLQATS